MNDLLRNSKDPLHKTGPEAEIDLLRGFSQLAHCYPRDVVLGAAINLIVAVVRQDAEKRDRAETLFDTYMNRAKHILLERHYDNLGKRRNIFPFTQNIDVPFTNFRKD